MEAAQVRDLHKPAGSNVPAVLINLSGLLIGVGTLATGWPTAHWAWTAGAMIWLAYFHHTWMMIFHSDVHYSLYKGRWHNIRSGVIVGTFLMVPFSVYRFIHLHHHRRANEGDDWELWPYCDPSRSLAFRRAFLVLDFLFGQLVGIYVYNRAFFVRHTTMTDPKLRRSVWLQYLLIVAFWGGLVTLVATTGAWMLFLKVYVIPAWLAGAFQTVRKLTEHLGLPAGPAVFGARTVIAENAMTKAVNYTSMGVPNHGLHHRYPQMPHQNLERAYEAQVDELEGAPVFHSHYAAIRDMCRHLPYPGIGANAVNHARGVESS